MISVIWFQIMINQTLAVLLFVISKHELIHSQWHKHNIWEMNMNRNRVGYLHPLGGVVADLRAYEAETSDGSGRGRRWWWKSDEVPQNTRRHLSPTLNSITKMHNTFDSDRWIKRGIQLKLAPSMHKQNDARYSTDTKDMEGSGLGPTILMGRPVFCWPINWNKFIYVKTQTAYQALTKKTCMSNPKKISWSTAIFPSTRKSYTLWPKKKKENHILLTKKKIKENQLLFDQNKINY